ncbi:MAG: hypothetical protein B7Y43_11705 [Sphingomonas sp. 28-62-20]|uniref:FMN-dependent NADH-azoreductase n=1 Tax=Sphingomonas sp. 28-62-20 TaxID=1970433 RepID=UPI000BDB05FE|nr:MAG: hypothetical protein B7Y43_11705 [Sphingomonas sp. 28-62-20]
MATLLRIDASARTEGSYSRQLGDSFETSWIARNPTGTVVRRDLALTPVPQIANETIAGFYTPAEAMTDALLDATALSDGLIAELRAADVLLVTTPMYNFGIPAALKAWVDQIVRIGHTFSYDGTSFTGLVTGKPVTIAIAYGAGGYGEGGALAALDLVRPYLATLFGFLGFNDVRFAVIEATTGDPIALDTALNIARGTIAALAA